MSREIEASTREIDWITVSIYFGLVLIGWLMIYAVGSTTTSAVFDMDTRHGVQLMWIGFSVFVGTVLLIIEGRFYKTFAYVFFGIAMLLLLSVLIGGTEIAGSKSWLIIGPIRIQPSEPAKFATCLALAAFMSSYNLSLQNFKNQAIAIGIIVTPMFLILLQGDAGSALVFSSLFIVLFREGMPAPIFILGLWVIFVSIISLVFSIESISMGLSLLYIGLLVLQNAQRRLIIGFSIMIIASIFLAREGYTAYVTGGLVLFFIIFWIRKLINTKKRSTLYLLFVFAIMSSAYSTVVNYGFNQILQPHQKDRINVWLKPSECDPLGALYNVTWSKIAIGSGGFAGKGFLEGTITKAGYVPEQETDFIFCTVGEEHGFVGTFAVILLFLLLLLRIVLIAERQRTRFAKVYAYGVASILFFHLLVNVGMTLGVMPVIGIPLPFISYGGSSLLAFTILLGILIRLDADNAR
jgi:rod shape determining protein RodA